MTLLLGFMSIHKCQQLKYIIEKSAVAPDIEVNIPGTSDKTKLSELSKSGGLLNAYEAVKLADTLTGDRKQTKEVLPKPAMTKNKQG